jgi:hypothetical protein
LGGLLTRLLIDGHVHVHDCYNEATFLTAAHANLSRHGEGLPTLLLAEAHGAHVFARWQLGRATWNVTRTEDSSALILGGKLLVIAGRQIVTAERIEVLAQLTSESFEDGCPLDETITRAQASGALVVLPWGVGKWLGPRGRRVARAAAEHSVLLGDNAGRPLGWPRPALFRRYPVLPGSDPLPMKSQECIVGTFGSQLTCDWDARHPAQSIGVALRQLRTSPSVLGRRVTPLVFLRQQIERLIKRRAGGT